MKYFEYGVRTHESENFVGKFGDKSNKLWQDIMHSLSRLGLQGWEIYHVMEKNNVTHFLMKREVSKEVAQDKYRANQLDTYPLGFVDHVGPDHNTY